MTSQNQKRHIVRCLRQCTDLFCSFCCEFSPIVSIAQNEAQKTSNRFAVKEFVRGVCAMTGAVISVRDKTWAHNCFPFCPDWLSVVGAAVAGCLHLRAVIIVFYQRSAAAAQPSALLVSLKIRGKLARIFFLYSFVVRCTISDTSSR